MAPDSDPDSTDTERRRGLQFADLAEAEIEARDHREIVTPSMLAIVTFRVAPPHTTEQERDELNRSIAHALSNSFRSTAMRLVIFILMLIPVAAAAQGDLNAERASLKGIHSFAADITLEGPRHLVGSDLLRSEVLLHRILHRLREAGVEVERVAPGVPNPPPHLNVHVNMLELDGGLVPFAISANFFQDVRLARGRREMSAITWDESVLGLVTRDLLSTIPQSLDTLIDQFAEDYLSANDR